LSRVQLYDSDPVDTLKSNVRGSGEFISDERADLTMERSGWHALVSGMREDPIQRWIIDTTATAFGVSPKTMETYQGGKAKGTIPEVLEFTGKWVLPFAAGAGAWSLGRAAIVGGLRTLAPKMVAAGALPWMSGQLAQVASRAVALGDAALPRVSEPLLEKAATVVGGAMGAGAYSGAETLADGGTPMDALKSAGIGGGATAAIDTLLRGAGTVGTRLLGGGTIPDAAAARAKFAAWKTNVAGPQAVNWNNKAADALAEAWNRGLTPESVQAWEKVKSVSDAMNSLTNAPDTVADNLTRLRPSIMAKLPEGVQSFIAKWFMTPEGAARASGSVTMAALNQQGAAGEAILSILGNNALASKVDMVAELGKAVGIKPGRKGWDAALSAIGHDYESMTTAQFAVAHPQAVPVFERFGSARALHEAIVKQGGEGSLPFGRSGPMAVEQWVPHIADPNLSGPKFEKAFFDGVVRVNMQKGMSRLDAEAVAHRIASEAAEMRNNPVKATSADFQRLLPGTLKELTDAGVPFIKDPFKAWEQAVNGMARRHVYAGIAGWNNELTDSIRAMALKEGASEAVVNTYIDGLLKHNLTKAADRHFAQQLIDVQTMTKMTFGPIANIAQPMNVLLYQGIKPFGRGLFDVLTGSTPKQVQEAIAIHESAHQAAQRLYEGTGAESTLDKWARRSLAFFNVTERNNKRWAGSAAYYDIRKTVAQALDGRLRGSNLERAQRRFADYNLDLGKITREGRPLWQAGASLDQVMEHPSVLRQAVVKDGFVLKPSELDIAYNRAMQLTQFTSDRVRRPFGWQTPYGRVLTQFKSFGLQQGRLMRDAVFKEMAHGNYKPLATLMTVFPVTGEIIGSVQRAVKGQPNLDESENGLVQAIGNVAAMGGFGVASNLAMASAYNKPYEVFFGPSVSDAMMLGTNIINATTGMAPTNFWHTVGGWPIVKGVGALMGGGAFVAQQAAGAMSKDGREEIARFFDHTGAGEEKAPPVTMWEVQQQMMERKAAGQR